jgi:hypothetical protein
VREAQRLVLEAIHQNNSDASEGVVIQFADRFARELSPGEALLVERRAAIFE